MDNSTIGRILIIVGLLVAAIGGYFVLGGKNPFGSLPGDVSVKSGNVSFAFPVVSCIVISVVLTILLNIFLRR